MHGTNYWPRSSAFAKNRPMQRTRISNYCMLMVGLRVSDQVKLSAANRSFPALVTGQIANEITSIGSEIENLFGVLDEEMLKLE